MTKLRMKREKDKAKAAKMKRLELRRIEWEVKNMCSSIMNDVVDDLEPFRGEDYQEDINEILQRLEDRLSRSNRTLEEEELWLEVVKNLGEEAEYTINTTGVQRELQEDCKDIMSNMEVEYMDWLMAELEEMGIETDTTLTGTV